MKDKKGYSRRKFISTIGASTAALPLINSFASNNLNAQPENKFNLKRISDSKPKKVIFILSDDHRYDFMRFIPTEPGQVNKTPNFLQTPNMDRMAKEGAHIQNTFVTTSLCSPSRASILHLGF